MALDDSESDHDEEEEVEHEEGGTDMESDLEGKLEEGKNKIRSFWSQFVSLWNYPI